MSKATKTVVAAISLMTLTAGGCMLRRNEPPDVLDPTPVAVDPAMERRNWEQSHAQYESTATDAGNTGFFFTSDPSRPDWQNGIFEPFIYLTNVVLSPVSLIFTPGNRDYRGATIEATHSGNPPLPNVQDEEQSETPPPTDAPPTGEQPQPPAQQ